MGKRYTGDTTLKGAELIGREIIVRWNPGLWYDAVVVQYFEDKDEHKLVYRFDDGIEITQLGIRRWVLLDKKLSRPPSVVLDGAIIQFVYPGNKTLYKAMIYDHNRNASILKIAYLSEHSTDVLKGAGWEYVTQSPCNAGEENAGSASSESFASGSEDDAQQQTRSRTRRPRAPPSRSLSRTGRMR